MQIINHRFLNQLHTLSVFTISSTMLLGCSPDEREHLADQFGDKVIEALEEEYQGDEQRFVEGECDPSWEECEEWSDDGFFESDRQEESGQEVAMGGFDSFGGLENMELLNPSIGGEFGEKNLGSQTALLEGFMEDDHGVLELWAEDRTSMIRIELLNFGLEHELFQSGGSKIVFKDGIAELNGFEDLHGNAASCFGDEPFIVDIDWPAVETTIVTVEKDEPDTIEVQVSIVVLADNGEEQNAHGTFEIQRLF